MLRGVNAVQERLQEHLRERAACSRAALFWSMYGTGTILYRRYRTIRSSRGNLAAHRSARTSRAGKPRSKEQLFGWGSFRRRDGYREDQVGEGSMAGSYGALTASLSRPRPFSPSRYVACERLVTCAPAYEAPPRFARSPSPSTDYDRVGGASNTLPRAATSYIVCAAHLRATAAARLALGRGARCAASPRRRTSRSPRRRVA